MRKKLFTFLLALAASVGMSWATVITWDQSKVSSMAMIVSSGSDSRTSDGITVTAVSTGEFVVFGDHGGAIEIGNGEGSGGGYLTFTSSVGNIAQIDIYHSGAGEWRNANGDWISPYYENFEGGIFTWSGTPAASITLTGDAPRHIDDITSIEFTIENGGGSAQVGLQVTELQVSPSWEDNPTMLSTSDMPGFVAITEAEATAWDAAPAGNVVLIFAFEEGNGATSLSFKNGVYQAAQAHNITYEDLYAWSVLGRQIFYTGGGSTPAEPVTVVFEANNNQKEVEVTLPHTFACDFQNGNGELDGIIQELYALQYGGYCQAFTVPTATGNAAVTASKDGNNHYIAINEAFEGTATVTGNYIKYLDTEQMGNTSVDYTLTISVQGSTPTPSGLQVIEMQVPDSWENDQQLVIVPDLPGFVVFTLEEAGTWAAPEGYADLIYASKNNEGVRATYFNNGVWGQEYVAGITRATVFGWASSGHRIFYTTDGSAPAQPSWVLDGDEWDEGTKTLTVNSNPGAGAYASQSEIENLIISDAVTSIGQAAFGGCSNISYVSCGNNIQTIGVGAFTMCGFTYIELPASVTTIGKSAFYSCSNLSSVAIGNNVASIGDHAFDACVSLTEITIPASVTTIGVDAFYNCTGMTDVYCYPNAADLTWNEDGCDDFKSGNATQCHVNADQLDAYQTKFNGVVRVTFVGDLPAPTPAGLQVTELQIPASWQNDQTLVTISDLPGFVAVSLEEAKTWDAAPAGYANLIYAGQNDEGVTATYFVDGVWGNDLPFGGFTRANIFEWASYGDRNFYTSGGSTPTPTPTPSGDANIFNYSYECDRSQYYPTKDNACNVYNFENEAAGQWKVEFLENYNRNNTAYANAEDLWSVLGNYYNSVPGYWEEEAFWSFVDEHLVPVFTLSQWDGSEYQFVSYGLVLAYANPSNAVEHAAVFRAANGSFRYLTDNTHGVYDDFNITFDSDLTDGLQDLVPEPSVPTDQEIADAVIALINAIPNPVAYNDECKDAIDAARAAYDALTDAQKALVANYGVLLDAETAYAQLTPTPSGECGAQGDNLLWELNTSTGVLTITGSGAMYDWAYDTDLPWYDNRLQITSVVLPSGITSIGTKAFRGCQNLASINMTENYPAGLTAINQEVFCHTALTSVIIPKSVVTIGQDAFYQSQSITDVYCYADPNKLTWTDFWGDDFNQSPAKSTQCHVKDCYLEVYNSKWNTGTTSTDVNVTFVGDLPGECGTPTPAVDSEVQDVIDLIDAIGSVTYTQACKDKIDAARDAYDALNADQKALVSNYSTLTDAEAAYAALIPVVTNYSISLDGITENADKVTLNKASAEEGETITLTPAAGYQITAFTASYASAYSVRVTADPNVNVYDATPYVGALPKEFTENVTPGLNGATFYNIEGDDPFTPVPASVLEYVGMNAAKDQMTIRVNDAFSGIIRVNYTYNVETCEWDEYEQQEICMGGTAQASVRVVCEAAGGVAPASKDDVTGAYSFTMPAGNVTITATVEAIPAPAPTAAVIGDPNNASEVETFLETYDGRTIDELIIDRPVLNNMYNTLCLPFDMNATQIAASSLNGVIIREFTGASVVGQTLELAVSDPVNAVVAGRPYFVQYSAASQLDDLHFEGVTINNAVLDDEAITFDGVTFKGTFTPFVMPNGLNFQGGYLFLGQNNQLFWPNTSNPLKPFRAYFYVDVESSTPGNAPKYRGMPARIVEGKNVATGVENAQSANQSTKVIVNGQLIIIKNDVRYNAQGQIVK